jgi:Outer membrane protein and related peptidoglycan-associated (lipo)proteins
MALLSDSLKDLITPELVSHAAEYLGEQEENITKGVDLILPSLLGFLLVGGNDLKIEDALKNAGKSKSENPADILSVFSGKTDDRIKNLIFDLLDSLFGERLGSFTSLIANNANLSNRSAGKLINMVTFTVCGFLGEKMVWDGISLSDLLRRLNSERAGFQSDIPDEVTALMGVAKGNPGRWEPSIFISETREDNVNKLKWLKWFIPLLMIFLLLFFWWKSCKEVESRSNGGGVQAIIMHVNEFASLSKDSSDVGKLTGLQLPNGMEILVHEGGIEDRMIAFLQSGRHKEVTSTELGGTWFDLDHIRFEFGSSTQLLPDSYRQLDNIAAILACFEDVKIRIGVYTDKKGEGYPTLKMSQERANTLKKIFSEKGLGNVILTAKGYGDRYAKTGMDAPEEERVADRRIAICFEK